MAFIKKNLVFVICMVVAVLVFAGGCFMAFSASGKVDAASQKLTSLEQQYRSLATANPAPSSANVVDSEENVEALKAQLASIREDLQRGSRISTSTDGIQVMAGVQQYISDMQRKVSAQTNDEGEPAPIAIPENFAFGFEKYRVEATPPDGAEKIALLDKQRQILAYLLNQLIAADPEGIESVERETIEAKSAPSGNRPSQQKTGFSINPAVSARVPGAIDTLAFKIAYTGKTNSLRVFLNQLAQFEMPIVVRSIEVDRPTGSGAATAPASGNDLDAIFGVFGGGSGGGNVEAGEAPDAPDPVVEDIVSRFTIVLEFIEIVLPDQADDGMNSNGEDLS